MKLFIVGGFIRDTILGIKSKDIDLMIVGATPEELESKGFTKTVGADFPVFLDKFGNEIALARIERKTGLGHTEFETVFDPSVTVEEDLMRRDLTCNSLAQEIDVSFFDDGEIHKIGEIIDPFNGRADLERGLLRHVSPAFAEDPLRVLRVARFAARFGFIIAPETVKLMRHIVSCGELKHLSKERVWAEVSRAIMESQPQNFFRVLNDCDAMVSLFGGSAVAFDNTNHRLMRMADSGLNERQRWMGLLFDVGLSIADSFVKATKMPNEIGSAIMFAVDFENTDKQDPESLMNFLNKWNQWRDQQRLTEVVELMGVVGSKRSPNLDTLRLAVADGGLINFNALSDEQRETLVGPEIGLAIANKRQEVIERWVTAA